MGAFNVRDVRIVDSTSKGLIQPIYCPTGDMIADILTKDLQHTLWCAQPPPTVLLAAQKRGFQEIKQNFDDPTEPGKKKAHSVWPIFEVLQQFFSSLSLFTRFLSLC